MSNINSVDHKQTQDNSIFVYLIGLNCFREVGLLYPQINILTAHKNSAIYQTKKEVIINDAGLNTNEVSYELHSYKNPSNSLSPL